MTMVADKGAAKAANKFPARAAGLVVLLLIAFALPFVVGTYPLFQATQVLVYAIALLGLNLLTGFNGQISLGHGAFYAIGAYTAAILLDKTGIPYWAVVPMSGAVCLLAGFLFGLPALRLEGLYLALATFALAVATPQLLKFHSFEPWTGGVQGITLILPDAPFDLKLSSGQWFYLYCLLWTIALVWVAWNLLRGRIGRSLIAIRDHPTAAASMGIDTALYKSLTFGVSAMYTGIAGALGALLAQFVSPDSFQAILSINFIVGSVVGGIFSIAGAFIGSVFIVFVPNIASQLSKAAPGAIYGVFLILMIYVVPTGLVGVLHEIQRRGLRMWFTFEGRCTRFDYWVYQVPVIVIAVLVPSLPPTVVLICGLLLLWPGFAMGIKRCHDRDRSGWFLLVSLIPVINIWAFVELGLLRGTVGPNRFGPDPLQWRSAKSHP